MKKGKTVRKILLVILRIVGYWALVGFFGGASGFLYEREVNLYGAARFVGVRNVIYTGELWEYIYTNPMAMMGRSLLLFFAVAIPILLLSALIVWGIQKGKLFPRIGRFDKFLIVSLILSVVTCAQCACAASSAEGRVWEQYDKVKACQTLADYESLLGRPLFEGTIQEKDKEWISTLGNFERFGAVPEGFAPGRTLVIFGMEQPRVYILLWMENGKVLHRNGCYQDVTIPKQKGAVDDH